MSRLTRRRALLVPAALMVAFVIGTQSAAAATVLSTSGVYGKYVFNDSMTHPGIDCYYGAVSAANQDLKKIVISGPSIWARDRTVHRDSQWVAWRYIVQHSQAGGAPPWQTYTTSSWVKAVAYDNAAFKFSSRTWTAPAGKNWQWQVEIVMRWFKAPSSTTVAGQVKLMDEYAVITYPPNPNVNNTAPCLPGQ